MKKRLGWISFGMLSIALDSSAASPEDIFRERIMPIFNSPNPSSCTECHLAGVELRHYLLPSAEKTFANLRDLGLIDLDAPEKSEILRFIRMTPESENYKAISAKRINPKLRQAELDAFSTWIIAAAADPKFRNAPALPKADAKTAVPAIPDAVIRHGRTDNLLESFERNIWALRFRCAGCHMPGGKKFEKHKRKHGFKKMAWLRSEGAAESMRHLMSSDLLDLTSPKQSELLLKALDEAEEEHGGGIKMRTNDTDYLAISDWIKDYANVMNGSYRKADDLPAGPKMLGTEIWLRVTGLPVNLAGRPVWLAVYPLDQPNGKPIAVSSTTSVKRPKTGIVIANSFLMRRSALKEDAMKPGRYIIELLRSPETNAITGKGKLFDWDAALEEATLLFSSEVQTEWKPGFKNVTVLAWEKS